VAQDHDESPSEVENVVILVVGGTGELGSAVVRRLVERGRQVAVLVRPRTGPLPDVPHGVPLVRGDLSDPTSLAGVCEGVEAVVATANTIVPRGGERVGVDALTEGYAELARQAERSGVGRLVFVSVPRSVMGRGATEFDEKQHVEQVLLDSRTPTTVVRPSLFMQSWLPAVGSRLALEGAQGPTLDRGFWLTRVVGATTHRSLDRLGVALLPGRGTARHSFVDLEDVAGVVAAAVDLPGPDREIEVGGPEAITWREVAAAHAAVLGLTDRAVRTPTAPMAVAARVLRPFSPAAANLLAVQHLVARVSTPCSPETTTALLGRPPVSVPDFLAARLAARRASEGVHA
jgi:uncharacterized protein YbjT (DUF2867 family)